jgi:hypothetical protein
MDDTTPSEENLCKQAAAAERREARLQDVERIVAVLRANPDLRLPYGIEAGGMFHFMFFDGLGSDSRAQIAHAARVLPVADWVKRAGEDTDDSPAYFDMDGTMPGGMAVKLTTYRDAVCERVVVGHEDRKVEVIVTPAVVTTVTKPVEIVEWHCGRVLAPADGEPAPVQDTEAAA